MHATNNLEDDYLGSGTYLRRSVKKHGKESFKKEILEYCETFDLLAKREREIIHEELIKDPLCMNLKLGGKGGWMPEHQIKGAQAGADKRKELRKTDLEWVKKNNKALSKGAKAAYAQGVLMGYRKKHYSWKGKKHSEKSRLKMSESKKGKCNGNKNSQFGTCWITKEGINKKIKKEELGNYLALSWVKGRVIKK